MKQLFDQVSIEASRNTTRSYSTSFSLGILFLDKRHRDAIYAVYGFVRFADEIVDTFHDYDKEELLNRFEKDTYLAIEEGISLNPILNSFQWAVNKYEIDHQLIDKFLSSMRMDLDKTNYSREKYDDYIVGSAEVVGLMCLKIFVNGNEEIYQNLKYSAMKLGSAFQKVNFLRDLKDDVETLGRMYFPGLDGKTFDESSKQLIEDEIANDFAEALEGIKQLPKGSRLGVYLAYTYYNRLRRKISKASAEKLLNERIRVSNPRKISLMAQSLVRHKLNLI